MKPRLLPKLLPRRSSTLPWNSREALPPDNPERRKRAADNTVMSMPTVFTFVLVDLIAEDAKLSKGKARKAVARGKVTVNGTVVYDPDMRVDKNDQIVFRP